MKKTFMLIPFAAMLLTSCGKAEYKLPGGYKAVDLTSAEAIDDYCKKLGENIQTTYKSFREKGIEVGAKVHFDRIYSYDKYMYGGELIDDNETTAEGINANITLRATGFDKDIRNWKVAADLEKLSAKIDHVDHIDEKENASIRVKNAALSLYFGDDRLMVDLSDKNLKKSAEKVIDGVLPDEDTAELYKTFVPTICQKYMADGILKLAGLLPSNETEAEGFEYVVLPEALDEADIENDVVSSVRGIMTLLGTVEELAAVKDAFTFAMYKDGRLGLGVNGDISPLLGSEEFDVSAMVLFNKLGELETVKFGYSSKSEDNYSYENYPDDPTDDESEIKREEIKGHIEVELKYGVKKIKAPNDKDYKGLPIALIIGD